MGRGNTEEALQTPSIRGRERSPTRANQRVGNNQDRVSDKNENEKISRVTRTQEKDCLLTASEEWQGDKKVSSTIAREAYKNGVRVMIQINREWYEGEKRGFSEEVIIYSHLLIIKRFDSEGNLHSYKGQPSSEWRRGGYWSYQYHNHGDLMREISGSPEKEPKSIAEKLDDLTTSGSNMLKTLRRRLNFAQELTILFIRGIDEEKEDLVKKAKG